MWVRSGSTSPAATYSITWVVQPHSGWIMNSASGVRVADGGDVGGADAGVHVALAVPDVHAPPGHALHVGAQPHVGAEQDLHVVAVLARMCSTTWTALDEVQQ